MKRKSNSFWQRAALGVIFVLIACYTFYHLLGLFDTEMETYAAGVTQESTVLRYSGYIFRDETVLTSSYSGVVDYRVSDGVKVSEGQMLARVFQEGSSSLREQIRRMDRQIGILEESTERSAALPDMGEIKSDLKDRYLLIVKSLADRDTAGVAEQSEDFLVEMNRMDSLIHGEESSAYVTLEELRSTRQSVLEDAGDFEQCYAQRSGYFYADIDGYEGLFTMDAASEESLSADSFSRLLAATERTDGGEEQAYGKLCPDSEWRFVVPIPLSDQEYFEAGATYVGGFGANGTQAVPLTLEYVKEIPELDSAFLVFLGDRMPDGFFYDRCQSVSLEVDPISGIYVPKSVVVREGGGRGVYILRGSVVRFRYVDILYEGSDYYLVAVDREEDEHGRLFLHVNDIIILNGKNLFDGRVMD